jgi:hypothetical protein
MRTWIAFVVGLLLLAVASSAYAEKMEVMLKSGRSGMVEVVETTPESVTVKFVKEGSPITMKVRAKELDPHSFYNVRRKHMEKTAENHVRLAVFCVENGMFTRGRAQIEAAREVEPELDQKLKDAPEIREKIADRLVTAARKHYKDGNVELCHEIAVLIATRLEGTKGAELAASVLDDLEKEVEEKRAKKAEARRKKIDDAAAEADKKAAKKRDDVMKPLEKEYDQARKRVNRGYRTKGHNKARDAFEGAAKDMGKLVGKIDQELGKAGDDGELQKMLNTLRVEVVEDAIKAYETAGTYYLNRQSVKNAEDLARAAVALDPGSKRAQEFMNRVTFAASSDNWGWGGGRRGGRR